MENGSRPSDHPASNFDASGYSQEDLDRLTGAHAFLTWDDLDYEDRLEHILNTPQISEWFTPAALDTLAYFRNIPWQWGRITARFTELRGFPPKLEKAVDAILRAERAAQADATGLDLDETRARQRPAVVSMDEVQAEAIEWLWWPYIAVGNLCMLVGDPGVGKSLLMTQLAASLSRGYPLPDQQGQLALSTGGPHATLLLSTEDGLADTLKPRLVAADADCSKVHVLTGWLGPEDGPPGATGGKFTVSLPGCSA